MADRSWFVLRVLPRLEIVAERLVRRLDYKAMCPYEEKLVRRGKSRHPRPWKIPLYPGYLFVHSPDWAGLYNHITGKIKGKELDNVSMIFGYLHPMWTDLPYFLPPADVDYLQSIADGKYKPDEPAQKLRVGDKVLIPEGLMQGYTGTATEISGKNVTIEIKHSEETRKIKLPLANVEKV